MVEAASSGCWQWLFRCCVAIVFDTRRRLFGKSRIDSRCCICDLFRVVSSAVDRPPGVECLAGVAFGAVMVAVQFHQLSLEVVAGGAEEVDVVGGDKGFGNVGVVSHRISLLVELRAQPFDFDDGFVDESTVRAAREWLGVTEPFEDVGSVCVECFGEGVKDLAHLFSPWFCVVGSSAAGVSSLKEFVKNVDALFSRDEKLSWRRIPFTQELEKARRPTKS